LKALGVLRLVVEQKADANARGWWQGEQFWLLSKLSREELEEFFLNRYEPTPVLAPWNGGSGFFRTWDAKNGKLRNSKNAAALEDLIASDDPRLKRLRLAVEEIRSVLPPYCETADVSLLSSKERNKLLILPIGNGPIFPVIQKNDSGKLQVQRALLRISRNSPFYTSALVEVQGEIKYQWLWGSGGNDGNIDYSGRFFENVKLVLMPTNCQVNAQLWNCALFESHSKGYLTGAAGKVGQFIPAGAGGANITTGTGSQNDTHLNPWDFVLALEGALLFSACATRRLDPNAVTRASAPFVVRSHATGFASPGKEKAQRGEQWMPLWSRPASLADVVALFGEARLQLNRQTANRPIDVARAISRLGVARGIDSFARYGYLERNGQSTLAVPLGRVNVRHDPHSNLIDDLAPWLDRLRRCARDKNAPARIVQAERRLSNAIFAALTHDYSPERWQAILRAAVAIELLQAAGTAFEARPIPPLRPEWVSAVDDGTVEVRLAVALGSAATGYSRGGHPIDSIRHHWLPLELGAYRFKISEKRLAKDSRVVMFGRDVLADCAAVVQRRLIEGGMKGQRHLPLVAARECGARLSDLAEFLGGSIDLEKVLDLARAFMALRWEHWRLNRAPIANPSSNQPDETWLALRLASLPWPLSKNQNVPAEPGIVRRLLAGDSAGAVSIAIARLRAAGIRPPLQAGITDVHTAKLWVAALAFPIDRGTALRAAATLDPKMKGLIYA
jgi:CRISPR-associated protein Csx17